MSKVTTKPAEDLNQLVTLGILRKELKDELRGYATKEDLKKFATKEDLKRFATKDDLKKFATKSDLKGFVTKKYLDKRLKSEFLYYNKSIIETMDMYFGRFEEKLVQIKDDFANDLKSHQEEMAALQFRQAEHSDQLENLDYRVGNVELRLADK
jgi:hypothetical protein